MSLEKQHTQALHIRKSIRLLECPLKNPSIGGKDLLIVVFMYADFLEAVSFIKFLRVAVRCLHMKIDPVDLAF